MDRGGDMKGIEVGKDLESAHLESLKKRVKQLYYRSELDQLEG